MFGSVWEVPDRERDRPVGSEFGLRPRDPRGRLERRRRVRALGHPVEVRPGSHEQRPRLPPCPQFSSVSSKQSGRKRSGCGAGVDSEWSERKTQAKGSRSWESGRIKPTQTTVSRIVSIRHLTEGSRMLSKVVERPVNTGYFNLFLGFPWPIPTLVSRFFSKRRSE